MKKTTIEKKDILYFINKEVYKGDCTWKSKEEFYNSYANNTKRGIDEISTMTTILMLSDIITLDQAHIVTDMKYADNLQAWEILENMASFLTNLIGGVEND